MHRGNFSKKGNYSGAPHLHPFKPARVAQVRFAVLNEQVSVDSESKALLNSYKKR